MIRLVAMMRRGYRGEDFSCSRFEACDGRQVQPFGSAQAGTFLDLDSAEFFQEHAQRTSVLWWPALGPCSPVALFRRFSPGADLMAVAVESRCRGHSTSAAAGRSLPAAACFPRLETRMERSPKRSRSYRVSQELGTLSAKGAVCRQSARMLAERWRSSSSDISTTLPSRHI